MKRERSRWVADDSRTVGFGNARAEVTAELDYDRITTNSESYDPDGQVVRSSQTVEQQGSEQEGDSGAVAGDMGFVMPSVRILDNMQLPPNAYVIRVKEVEAGQGELRPAMVLAMDPQGGQVAIPGEATTEPTFGLPATWIEADQREEAAFRGYTVVDPATVVTTHLTETLKDNMPEFLSYAETQKLLDDLPKEHQKLIADLVPGQISVSAIQRVLQNLLAERVSIRDLPTILEGVSEASASTQNIVLITEHVRSRLARQISHANTGPGEYIPLITLSPDWEQNIAESIVGQGEDRQLSMAPSRLQEFVALVRDAFDEQARQGEVPVLLAAGPASA